MNKHLRNKSKIVAMEFLCTLSSLSDLVSNKLDVHLRTIPLAKDIELPYSHQLWAE